MSTEHLYSLNVLCAKSKFYIQKDGGYIWGVQSSPQLFIF